ncbi:hypothetical protein FQN57_003514 [Myotisia sp. PD_48]|nr:hypothetical protein FQN57_003514 [Myotisia sp. PD_48]
MHDNSKASSRLRVIQNHLAPSSKPSDGDAVGKRKVDFSSLASSISHESELYSLWYVVVTAALLSFHQEPAVGQLWEYISRQGHDRATLVSIARRIRESCLKASVLVGFPRGINSLSSLHASTKTHTPEVHEILAKDTSLRSPIDGETKFKRGKAFFAKLYANHTEKILGNMGGSSGGDLSYFAVASVYGELMAETSILGEMDTVVLEFICCLADDVAPQAKGHFFGSYNMGATGAQIKGSVAILQEVARQLGLEVPGTGRAYEFLSKADSW